MSHPYRRHTDRRATPQSEALPGQVPNSAGGHAYAINPWDRLRRFLILGSEGGTYYIGERKLTQENAAAVEACLDLDGDRTMDLIVEVSQGGLAPKNDPALFALARACGHKDPAVRKLALSKLALVARIGTHLFHFAEFVEGFRGWGRGLREAVVRWYLEREPDSLALQIVKYKQRDGWSHRDLLRLSHPDTPDPERNAILRYAVKGEVEPEVGVHPLCARDAQMAQEQVPIQLVLDAIGDGLPRECLPSASLNDPKVWQALLPKMGLIAMIRNLGKMTQVGAIVPMSEQEATVCLRLHDGETIRKARVHPVQILLAQKTYAQGQGFRGKLTWTPNPRILDALNDAFYKAFQNVEPTGKRLLLGIDVSSSMGWGAIGGSPLTAAEGAAAMALVTASAEPTYAIHGFAGEFVPLPISPRQRLDDVLAVTRSRNFGRTDCALPMLWALQQRLDVDCFLVYTDNETWHGRIHPVQALQQYRRERNPQAKLVVIAMASNGFSIADPRDPGMLDVVGFDASVPGVLHDFIANSLDKGGAEA